MKRTFIGLNCIEKLRGVLEELKPEKIFLVTGRNSYSLCGAEQVMSKMLSGYSVTRFSDFSVNPRVEDLKKGIKKFNKASPDLIVAVGGGSVIDMAKLINFFAPSGVEIEDYMREVDRYSLASSLPMVAIPTTSGTGSEATHFAVLYIEKNKFSVAHESIKPEIVFLDPQFAMSLPHHITASGVIDTLSQAIESLWAVGSTEKSKEFSTKAIKIIKKSLPGIGNQFSEEVRLDLALAGDLAGQAINISKTTAPHAISYPITSFFGIPHGHAVGLTLGEFIVENCRAEKGRLDPGLDVVRYRQNLGLLFELLGCENEYQARDLFNAMMSGIGLERDFRKHGISGDSEIELILDHVNMERLANNPIKMNRSELKRILLKIQAGR